MRMIALLALLALPPEAALAQGTGDLPPPSPQPTSQLPLAAMRHQQPREDTVRELELGRAGSHRVEQQGTEQQRELDQLYNEILQRSTTSDRK